MTIVTTSWDDGHILDKKLSALLDRYHLKGTFYIAKEYLGENRLSDQKIAELSTRHEIGAHTIHHQLLSDLSVDEARKEITESKKWIESITGKECRSFCYPAGYFNEETEQLVANAGFTVARTVRGGAFRLPDNYLFLDPTLQVYPFPLRKKAGGGYVWIDLFRPLITNKELTSQLGVSALSCLSWSSLAKKTFRHARNTNGVFHLWGHSWEIEKYGMWEELEEVFIEISNTPDVQYLTNSELCRYDNRI